MAKSFPLLLAGGAALILLSGKKRKPSRKRKDKPKAHVGTIKIGLFEGSGAHRGAVKVASEFLSAHDGVDFRTFNTNDVLNGGIDDLDVVFFPGGSGAQQGNALGESGREKIRQLVAAGMGYIGICAGSYLASQGNETKLKLVNFYNKTGSSWKRGNKDVLAEADFHGRPIKFKIHYENGPLFAPTTEPGIDPYVPLGIYVTETYSTKNDTHKGEMVGTPVVAASKYGDGRVLLFSPNPMLGADDALQFQMFSDAMRWVADGGDVPPDLKFEEVFVSGVSEARDA